LTASSTILTKDPSMLQFIVSTAKG